MTEYWFDQLIDHNNPTFGTFKQRYFFDDRYWKGDGAPVVLNTPGEDAADEYAGDLANGSLLNGLMELYGAAGIVLEHRYWGKSSPYPDLTAQNLQYLAVAQAVEDLAYFVQTVQLPWTDGRPHSSKPDALPWINLGCSYSGLLTAYTQEKYSSLFAASWASSAPVQADGDYWEYWEPIEEGMPKNCSADVRAGTAYMDNLLQTGTPEQVTALKAKFGLESLQNDDFGAALQWPLNTWQSLVPTTFANQGQGIFFNFCDAIETISSGQYNTAATGVGLPLALDNWAAFFKAYGPDKECPGSGGACYSSYNYASPSYTDVTVTGSDSLGDPGNSSSIVSSLVTPAYSDRRCAHTFPNADGTLSTHSTSDLDDMNTSFKGWNLIADHLFVTNGEFDPWRSASLSSRWAPAFMDTPTQEISVIPGGHHCWDWRMDFGNMNKDVYEVQKSGIVSIHAWLDEWYTAHPTVTKNLAPLNPDLTPGSTIVEAGGPDPNAADNLAVGNSTSTSTGPSSTSTSDVEKLQNELNDLINNKRLAKASYVLNGILLLALIAVVVALITQRRRTPKDPSWTIEHGDQMGAYGSGARAGGRGVYQTLKGQT
ncbi:hypothetical protein FRB99_008795 [Tulasnella sp. 403]|nr:hypothetical protein FRB99_008795 [Tulasnella sp. 403]